MIKPPSHISNNYVFHLTVNQAMDTYGETAVNSMKEEIMNLLSYDTFKPVDIEHLKPHQFKKIISSSMFLKDKRLPTGEFEKLKARFVAGGHQQDRTIYAKEDTSSPTASIWSVMLTAAIAAKENRMVKTIDIGSAYLNASIDTEVLLRIQPTIAHIILGIRPEFSKSQLRNGSLIVRLNRALYGCIESAKLWNKNISATLTSIGYKPTKMDPCVFQKTSGKDKCKIVLWVDDLQLSSTNEELLNEVSTVLRNKYGTIKEHDGKLHNYLGMNFDFSRQGTVKISMDGYIKETLAAFKATGSAKTPATLDLFKINTGSTLLSQDDKLTFHSAVAKLLYLAKRTRPDMLTAVAFLTTRVQQPTTEDMQKLERALSYLNGTKELTLHITPASKLSINAHIDASYGVHADGKGHTGATMNIGKGGILTKSSKQKIVAKSSTEAELIGISDFASPVIQIREFLRELGHEVGPATILQDNLSTLKMIENGRPTSDSTRHISIRHFFVKDRVDAGDIKMKHCRTAEQTADILTKPLQGFAFVKHRADLLGLECNHRRGVLDV